MVRLAVNGSLLQFLTKNRENPYINVEQKQVPFTHIDKVKIARDTAKGMLHLANKKVHKLSEQPSSYSGLQRHQVSPQKGDFVSK